jgi:hypothetical protein
MQTYVWEEAAKVGSLTWRELRIAILKMSPKRLKRKATREVARERVIESTAQQDMQGLVPPERRFKLKLLLVRDQKRCGKQERKLCDWNAEKLGDKDMSSEEDEVVGAPAKDPASEQVLPIADADTGQARSPKMGPTDAVVLPVADEYRGQEARQDLETPRMSPEEVPPELFLATPAFKWIAVLDRGVSEKVHLEVLAEGRVACKRRQTEPTPFSVKRVLAEGAGLEELGRMSYARTSLCDRCLVKIPAELKQAVLDVCR